MNILEETVPEVLAFSLMALSQELAAYLGLVTVGHLEGHGRV
jgi:hypothetical protein